MDAGIYPNGVGMDSLRAINKNSNISILFLDWQRESMVKTTVAQQIQKKKKHRERLQSSYIRA
jgi:hypothetical protein